MPEENYPCTGPDKPQGLQEVVAPRILRQLAHECGKVVSLMHRPPLRPTEQPWYSFLLEAEETPGPLCSQDQINEKSQITHQESNPLPSDMPEVRSLISCNF
jgi:hypothetical protein